MISINQNVSITGNVEIGNTVSIQGGLSTSSSSVTGDVYSNTISEINMDYNPLRNHPHINNRELIGNKTSEELGLEPTISDITEQDIDRLIYGG